MAKIKSKSFHTCIFCFGYCFWCHFINVTFLLATLLKYLASYSLIITKFKLSTVYRKFVYEETWLMLMMRLGEGMLIGVFVGVGESSWAELNWQNATKHLGNCVTNTHNLILTFLNRYQLQHSTTSTLYKANFDTWQLITKIYTFYWVIIWDLYTKTVQSLVILVKCQSILR